MRHALLALSAMLLALALGACSSAPDAADEQPTEKTTNLTPPEPPPPEQLANQPCGNPKWATLPPGAEPKAAELDDEEVADEVEATPQPAPAEGADETPIDDADDAADTE